MINERGISRFSITQQVILLAALFFAGFAFFTSFSVYLTSKTSVNGPIYGQIVQGKDLVADILPPPEYVIEAYLVTFQAIEEADPAKITEHLKSFTRLRKEFDERQVYWTKELADGEAKTLLTGDAAKAAREFFTSAEKDFFPALQRGDVVSARSLMRDILTPHYSRHRTAIDRIVTITNARNDQIEKETSSLLSRYHWFMMVIVLVVIGISVLASFQVIRSIHGTISSCAKITNRIAEGDLSFDVPVVGSGSIKVLLQSISTMTNHLREIISRTVEISSGIASASSQLHATSAQIAAGTEEVSSQTSSLAIASEEMSSTSSDIARNCAMAVEASHQTADSANTGAKVVNETMSGMNVIAERVRQTSKTIEALGTRSDQIGAIVSTIEDIADQTNLLALNAAIEAARAGEQGRGFAVVADEVRALAERTTKATREIGEMIKAIQNETRDAVKAMEEGVNEVEKGAVFSKKSGQALDEILERINEVTMQINQIATAAEQQTATTGVLTGNIQQITEEVNRTARGAVDTAGAAAQLATQAKELQNIVSRFRLA
jgi:methyl-accepting chemotaxis protein